MVCRAYPDGAKTRNPCPVGAAPSFKGWRERDAMATSKKPAGDIIKTVRAILRSATDKDGRIRFTTTKQREEQRADALANMLLHDLSLVQLKRLRYRIQIEIGKRPRKATGRPPKDPAKMLQRQTIAVEMHRFLVEKGMPHEDADSLTGGIFSVTGKTARYGAIPKKSDK
jgi:hypothetical protein